MHSHNAVEQEQAVIDNLFRRLSAEVDAANVRLNRVLKDVDPQNPDADALLRRETEYHSLHSKLDQLATAHIGLVFGRIDIDAPGDNVGDDGLDRRYIGRIGMLDKDDDLRTLLLDWRAQMAQPFYLATAAHPEGVHLRRHIRTRGQTVIAVHDEALVDSPLAEHNAFDSSIAKESGLIQALNAPRGGHMTSIVETIQREQDVIIRDPSRQVMVVEGGPGTGKTAVALHRIAYLMYHHRDFLSKAGVLIVGPNRVFLDYISQVLPELGETGVVLSTIGELCPGITPIAQETMLGREVKGSAEMVEILRAAIAAYQALPDEDRTIIIEGTHLVLTPKIIRQARTRARRARKPHNEAQHIFALTLADSLAATYADVIGKDPLGKGNLLGSADVIQLADDVLEEEFFTNLIEEFWPTLSATQVLANLLSSREAIAHAAAEYDDLTQHALYREQGSAWTSSDVALLDELRTLLGEATSGEKSESSHSEEDYDDAEYALDTLASSASTDNDDDFDAEILEATDVIDAKTLARRHTVNHSLSTAQKAVADPDWAYGHVVIDEAQELSPMEWRMVFRRCPSKWMTLVGDVAQTSAPAGVDDWAETLEPFVAGRFRHHRLTVNYRTPRTIADYAHDFLLTFSPDAPAMTALREGEKVKKQQLQNSADMPRVGVHTTAEGRSHAVIDASNVEAVKGLEFDHVTVLKPQEIIAASPQGNNNLYVALTRATQTLTVIE